MIQRSFIGFTKPALNYMPLPDKQPEPVLIAPKTMVKFLIDAELKNTDELRISVGDAVCAGEKILPLKGSGVYAISPVSGVITRISSYTGMYEKKMTEIIVEVSNTDSPPVDDSFAEVASEPGIEVAVNYLCEMPGAPDFRRLADPEAPVKRIVILGCDRDLMTYTNQYVVKNEILLVKAGVDILRKISGINDIVMAVPYALVQSAGASGAGVMGIPDTYPAGMPQMIYLALRDEGSPASMDATLFLSAESVASLGKAFAERRIPTAKLVTVVKKDGRTRLIKTPVGTPVADILKAVAEPVGEGDRVILGGPMTGCSIYDINHPVLPSTDTILIQDAADIAASTDTPCINCGRCVHVCPVKVPVNILIRYLDAGEFEAASEVGDLFACIECGFCSVVCESRIPILQFIRLAKHALNRMEVAEEENA